MDVARLAEPGIPWMVNAGAKGVRVTAIDGDWASGWRARLGWRGLEGAPDSVTSASVSYPRAVW